jgi:hypothetical protein
MARSLSPGAKATLALWGAAILWDLNCPKGQTISESIERGLNNRRTEPLVTAAVLVTSAHLLRAVNDRYDLYAIGFRVWDRVIGKKL